MNTKKAAIAVICKLLKMNWKTILPPFLRGYVVLYGENNIGVNSPKRKNKSYQNGPGRSRLAPYAEQIKAWKNQGMTLREIADKLQKYGCSTTAQNLSLFLRKK